MRSLAPSLTHYLAMYVCLSIFFSSVFIPLSLSNILSLSQCLPVYSFYLSHALFVFKSVIFQLIYFSSSAFYRTFLCNYLSLSSSFPGMQVIFPYCCPRFTMEETSTLFRTASDSQSAFLSLHVYLYLSDCFPI